MSINFRIIWFSSIKKIFKFNKIIKPVETSKVENDISEIQDNFQETFSFDRNNEKKEHSLWEC